MEQKEEAKYIERVEIKGLWGRYDVDWKLNPDVNILVGDNGVGKSTIFNIVFQAIEKCGVSLKSENIINYKEEGWIDSAKISFKQKPIALFSVNINGIERDTTNIIIPKIDYIQTFDTVLDITDLDRRFKNHLNTPIDFYLNEKIDDYVEYQLNQNKKLRVKGMTYDVVFEKLRYLIDTLNSLFSPTEKRVDEDENRLSFLLEDNTKITPIQLSSGEKQLLIILLTVLCQDEKPSILLMDEPELSLHVSWQYELIKIIRQLNPNCQIIIVTHSTSIFAKGWMDKFFFMDGKEGIRHKILQTA